ncbi:MAG: hypothetical protein JWQ32_1007 [Marmoricola sp.]|nr:hypothetical protein [Marmoricola sp.]
MKSPIQRRVAIAALLLAPVLGACGFSAQTDQVYQAAAGVNDRSGNVDILNALVVSGTDGVGTLSTTLVDNDQTRSDELTSVTGPGIEATTAGIVVPAGGHADISNPGADGGPQVVLRGAGIKPGQFVTLTFVFASGQSTTLQVQVFAATGDYTGVPLPSPSTASPTS